MVLTGKSVGTGP